MDIEQLVKKAMSDARTNAPRDTDAELDKAHETVQRLCGIVLHLKAHYDEKEPLCPGLENDLRAVQKLHDSLAAVTAFVEGLTEILQDDDDDEE